MTPDEAQAWQGAINSVNQAANTIATSSINYKTRQWNEKIMDIQRGWALEDWNRQNQYNSPESQMERLKSAGLNPNLVYGTGVQAAGPAGTVRSSDVPKWDPHAPTFPTDDNQIGKYLAVQMQENQLDLIKQQMDVMKQDAALKAAQTYATIQQGKNTEFGLGVKTDTRDVMVDQAQANYDLTINKISQLQHQTDYIMHEDERRAALNSPTVLAAAENVLLIRQKTAQSKAQTDVLDQALQNLKKDETLKDFNIRMQKSGLNPSDPAWLRIINQILNSAINPNRKMDFPSFGDNKPQ